MRKKRKKLKLIVSLVFALTLLSMFALFNSEKEQDIKASPEGGAQLLGNNLVTNAPTANMASAVKFVQAKTNYLGGIALDDQGGVWTWGFNEHGMLGFYNSADGYAGGMRRVNYFTDNPDIKIKYIEAGYRTNYAVDTNGVVYAWGRGIEGQMGNGTVRANNPKPVIVSSLDGIKIDKVYTTCEAASATYAIAEDGKVYAWGYADGYRIDGKGGYVSSASELKTLSEVGDPSNPGIKELSVGDVHGVVLGKDGKVYTWGNGDEGKLGNGGPRTKAKEVTFFSDKEVLQVSAGNFNTLVLVKNSDGTTTTYQFGGIYTAPEVRTATSTPREVEFDLASSEYGYDTPPNIRFIEAGKYVNYMVDTYGRIWSWGFNYAYSFATNGGLQNKHRDILLKATQQPATLGDGDTQGTTTSAFPAGPVFSGRRSAPNIQYYLTYGQWTDLTDGLHPTIYDKKYCQTVGEFQGGATTGQRHSKVYLVDEQGRRVIYVVKRDNDGTYSGNYYVAEDSYTGAWAVNRGANGLPAGVTTETSVPAIKEDEAGWIGLAVDLKTHDWTGNNLKEVPNIASIDTFQSSTLFLDSSGNLYKTGLDGSGTIAWGWDYSVYENGTSGNNAESGLYNMYNYEMVFMRGAPRLSSNSVSIESPLRKIYHSEDEASKKQVNKVTIDLGRATKSSQLNIEINPELKEAKYVVIPYDKNDPNSLITEPTEEEFNAAYGETAYTSGDLIALNKAEGKWTDLISTSETEGLKLTDDGHIIITDNCLLWVKATTTGYSAKQTTVSRKVYDNYYTDTTVCHDGKNSETPNEQVYEATDKYIVKTEASKDSSDEDMTKYGLPLDKNGEVISGPHFGYDEVTIRAFDESDPEYKQYIKGWYIIEGTKTSVDYSLDDVKYLKDNKFTHTFNYKRDVKGWVTITYKGRYLGSTQDIDPYVMDGLPGNEGIVGNKETVKKSTDDVDITLERTPVDLSDAQVVYYKIDGGSEHKLEGGKLKFNTIKYGDTTDMEVIIYYNQAELFIRQMIMNDQDAVVVPKEGYFRLNNTDGTAVAGTYNKVVNSGKASDTVAFKKVNLNTDAVNSKYTIDPVLQEFYKYCGYRLSTAKADHDTTDLKKAPDTVTADFDQHNKYYVTIYLEPTLQSGDVPFYNWDYKLNEFGSIK